jgi:glyoxylase-like metal-dependent hydrolase (beta-lactamase superfamily II)
MTTLRFLSPLLLILFVSTPWAADKTPADNYPESLLYNKPIKIADNVYSAIGATQPYTYANAGHNNNLSFVIGEKSVLVVNGSSSYLLAKALHDEIKKITAKPVSHVVDENGQLHAVLGNNYWKEQGATLIAHVDAEKEVKTHGAEELVRMKAFNKERGDKTALVPFDKTFDKEMSIDLGGLTAKLMYFGQSHSAGDISVYIPERNVLLAGDIAFHQRMMPIFEETSTKAWLNTWKDFAPFAKDKILVPGHGVPTDFATIDKTTRGYLEFLHAEVRKLLKAGGTLADTNKIDQSAYRHLHTYEELSATNAMRVFTELEME